MKSSDRESFQIAIGDSVLLFKPIPPGETVARISNSNDKQRVVITKPYWLAESPLTEGQGASISDSQRLIQNPTNPLGSLSWYDSFAICEAANTLFRDTLPNGYKIRLPTQMEWQIACEGGRKKEKIDLQTVAVYGGGPNAEILTVKTKQPNGFGLYDMIGLVDEWCIDGMHPINEDGDLMDPVFPVWGEIYANRGGDARMNTEDLGCDEANYFSGDSDLPWFGMRLAIAPAVQVEYVYDVEL